MKTFVQFVLMVWSLCVAFCQLFGLQQRARNKNRRGRRQTTLAPTVPVAILPITPVADTNKQPESTQELVLLSFDPPPEVGHLPDLLPSPAPEPVTEEKPVSKQLTAEELREVDELRDEFKQLIDEATELITFGFYKRPLAR